MENFLRANWVSIGVNPIVERLSVADSSGSTRLAFNLFMLIQQWFNYICQDICWIQLIDVDLCLLLIPVILNRKNQPLLTYHIKKPFPPGT